jgi:hypothetical protein
MTRSTFLGGGDHDGAVYPSSGMVLLAEHTPTPPPGASSQGVGQGRRQRVLAESIKQRRKLFISTPSL